MKIEKQRLHKLKASVATSLVWWFLIASLSGCSTFYYGYSKAEWQQMNDIEKHNAKQKYEQVLKDKDEILFGDAVEAPGEVFDNRVLGVH